MSKEGDYANRKVYWYSNEGSLNKTFPFIRRNSETVFAVGSDQGLDILAATAASGLEMVDKSVEVHALMGSVLKIAGYVFRAGVDGSSKKRFFNSFDRDKLNETEHILSDELEGGLLERLMLFLEKGVPANSFKDPFPSYGQFMKQRAQTKDASGRSVAWYGSDEGIGKVVSAYANERIKMTTGDLTDKAVINTVKDRLVDRGDRLGVMYVSNAEEHIKRLADGEALEVFWESMEGLPVRNDAVIVRTAMDFGNSWLGSVLEDVKDPLFNLYLSWHYNVEDMGHHRRMSEVIREYRSGGWKRVADIYRRQKWSEAGISYLSLEKTTEVGLDYSW